MVHSLQNIKRLQLHYCPEGFLCLNAPGPTFTVTIMILKVIFVISICIQGIQSNCQPKTIQNIEKVWTTYPLPPEDKYQWYGGVWTVHQTSSKETGVNSELKCLQEVVNIYESKGTAKERYSDSKFDQDTTFTFVQEKPGVYVQKHMRKDGELVVRNHVVYLNTVAGVKAIWTCAGDKTDTYILVRNYKTAMNNPEVKEAISQAWDAFQKAGVQLPQGIHTDCPCP